MKYVVWSSLSSRMDGGLKTVAVEWKSLVTEVGPCGICVGRTFELVGRNGG